MQHFRNFINLYSKNYLDKLTAILFTINTILIMTRLIIRSTAIITKP